MLRHVALFLELILSTDILFSKFCKLAGHITQLIQQ